MTKTRAASKYLAAAMAFLPCACTWSRDGVLYAEGPIAHLQRSALIETTVLIFLIILPLLVFLPLLLWRYRLKRPKGEYRPDWTFSWFYEVLIWGVPVVLVAILAVITWDATHKTDPFSDLSPPAEQSQNHPTAAPPLDIDVIALDWKFLFLDTEHDIASVGTLAVPAGRDVVLHLTSDATMQSFTVPRLGGQIYAMAGMVTELHLRAERTGTYRGLNTQYNGKGFARQKFNLLALDPGRYAQWIAAAHRAPPLTASRYRQLAQPGTVERPIVFGSVEPDLFDKVVARYAKHAMDPKNEAMQ